ncbi:hypothetical protein [uncultured Brevundimonas sp.]|uniref:hypothetical protein n=1 Tax=uncultured Brevundimonas sp. TaxID=213418 RepID=UPI0025E08F89|nr:hypothetical protein [uncultured Brevundimonas sp.]
MADGTISFQTPQPSGTGKRLLFPVSPAPGETILGYITRVVEANHLGSVGSFLALIDLKLNIKGDYLSRMAEALPELADLVGADMASLAGLWGAKPLSGDGKRRLGGVYLRPHMICQNVRRHPAIGGPVETDQATWMVKHLNFCPVSWRSLVDRCGVCRRQLTWPLARSLNRCEGCGASGARRAGPAIAQQDRQILAWVLSLFSPNEEIVASAVNRVPPFFRIQSATDVYELTIAFGRATYRMRTAGRRPIPSWSPRDLADGARLILDYPRSVWDLYRDQRKREQPSLILQLSSSARESSNACVSSNVERLIKEHRRNSGGGRGPATSHSQDMTLSDAGHLLSTTPAHVRELVAAGHLPTRRASPGDPDIKVERAAALHLRARAKMSVSRRQLKAAFSLPDVAIEQLLSTGWLSPEEDQSVLMLRGAETLSGTSARRLISELHRFERSDPCVGDIPLSDALRGVGGREKPWAPIITAAIKGRLPGGLRILKIEGRSHLAVHGAAARAMIMGGPNAPSPYRFEPHEYGVFWRDWMTPGEVEAHLNCTAQDVSWLRARKLLSKLEHETPRYARKEVEGIGLRFMTSREAASRLGLPPKDIWQLLEARPEVKSIGQGFHERDGLETAVQEEAGKPTWWN